ncbi:DUF6624 domain-containing protein [Actinacidiphila oryziradicis]|uniref:Uncharacterized protein n=1 Tax=Actinacidiphila oryziradicis TaxID=2571141 RepID=A0A4U0RSN4_9ACTN|nr:DUF6624 domain-containing protein [Actinacidiphila oryziradicis]TJZ98422.1 hypothetical protein FCI23_48255 [Actinacidiphila oryziradicis]
MSPTTAGPATRWSARKPPRPPGSSPSTRTPDQDFQRQALHLLEKAVQHGEATPKQLAYLTDRCLMHQGRPQIYGTQYTWGPNGVQPYLIADREQLDTRRTAVGLLPYAEYDAVIRLHYIPLPV